MNRRHFVASLGMTATLGALSQVRGAAPRDGRNTPADIELAPNPVWPRPAIVPVPKTTAGVVKPVLSLNGTWKFALRPTALFWSNEADPSGWGNIQVPGECTMQGYAIARNTEYPFKKVIPIPADFRGKKIILRFDGLYSYGRVWVNGHYVRDHHGGFTSWDCEITPFVTAGKNAWITVGVTDESDNISWQSNYAMHYIGGILRDVRMFAVPSDYVTRFHVETEFDSRFTNAILKVALVMATSPTRHARVELRLKDPSGKSVPIRPATVHFTSKTPGSLVSIPVTRPEKWDSEHPHLYTLEATVKMKGSTTQTLVKRFGFRKVEARGNKVYVNGRPVKFRGGCRHDVYPTRGRSTTPELDEQDVRLLKGANFNFVRTSHYPPTEIFLDYCDRHGLYTEEETAVCFVQKQTQPGVQNDPNYTSQFMNQFAEMIERDRDHPCIALWSLGNESQWGNNFAREYSYVKIEDPTRPVIFSYPDTVPMGVKAFDILSDHYPKFESDFPSASLPRLNDEFGHIPCYVHKTLRRDPGVRNYWGKSIKKFWERMFAANGCLGGSIWASIDEVFMLPRSCVGYGEWGVIDGWRREKPEYWLAKKAYSPTRVSEASIENPGPGNPLKIPIRNEFNHTNLDEVRIEWNVGSDRGEIRDLDVEAHSTGLLTLPARAWQAGELVGIKFIDREDRLLDEYELPVGRAVWNFPSVKGPAPRMLEDSQSIRILGENFEIVFSKASGLIHKATYKGHTILEGGPVLNLAPVILRDWWLTSLKTRNAQDEAVIEISGNYKMAGESRFPILVYTQFRVQIDGRGLLTTNFEVQRVPQNLNEIGVAYILPRETDQLSWDRRALWSVYPSDHIGRTKGVANKVRSEGVGKYRVAPEWAWAEDMKDFFLFGIDDPDSRGTNDFRSQKQNIWFSSGIISRTGVRARAESDATHAARAEIQDDSRVRLNINTAWAYPEMNWGNECPALPESSTYKGIVRLRLTDNDSIQPAFKDR